MARDRTPRHLVLKATVGLAVLFLWFPLALIVLYAFTTDDRAVSRAFQGRMVEASPVIETAELATSHSPFLSAPVETADAIERLAR